MKRALQIILACFLLVSPLAAESTAESAQLFDWFYPREKPYQTLQRAAQSVNARGWLVDRMTAGERIPQASARELAEELKHHPSMSQAGRDALAEQFQPETAAYDLKTSPVKKEADQLTLDFTKMAEKLDDLEATIARNNYDKSTFPGLSVTLFNAWQQRGAGGALFAENRGLFFGGMTFNFAGESDAGSFNYAIGLGFTGTVDNEIPQTISQLGSNGLGFLVELGTGGFEFKIGTNQPMLFSTLVLAEAIAPANNLFFVDQSSNWQPEGSINTLDLRLPSAPAQMRGLYIRRQGTGRWWPFTNLEFIYAPHWQYQESWHPKDRTWGLRLDWSKGGLFGGFLDSNLFYGALVGSGTDDHLITGDVDIPPIPSQGALAYGIGIDSQFADGTNFLGEFASSSYSKSQTSSIGPYLIKNNFADTAFVVQVSRPISLLNLAFEYATVGPYYLTGGRDRHPMAQAGGAGQSMLDGLDPWVTDVGSGERDIYWPQNMRPALATPDPADPGAPVVYNNGELAAGTPGAGSGGRFPIQWRTVARNPQALISNTNKMAFKGETAWSFLSMGFNMGMVSQINATGPYIQAAPYFENHTTAGWLLPNVFGEPYYYPPPPNSAGPPINPNAENPLYHQWNYTRFADSGAVPAIFTNPETGVSQNMAVHWQQLTQDGYRQVAINLLMSERGLGDPNVLQDSLKSVNYLSGVLRVDIKGLLRRVKPFELTVVGEMRDVAPSAGLPNFGDPGNPAAGEGASFLTHGAVVGYLRYGVTNTMELIGMMGNETIRSDHGYYPLMGVFNQSGIGADFDLDSLLSTLKLRWRSRRIDYTDSFFNGRNFGVWETMFSTIVNY